MFKNMKLGIKQGLGFGIMICFALILGMVGWSGLGNVDKSVNIADDQNRLVKYALEIRRQEKNYLIYKDAQSAEDVLAILVKIETQIKNTKGNLEKEKDLHVIAVDYRKAFEKYVDFSSRQKLREEIMVKASRKFMSGCDEFI